MASFGKIFTYPNNSRVHKSLIAAKYNGLVVEEVLVKIGIDNKTTDFLAKFPLGKLPCFEGADGFTLYESNAIASYIANAKADTILYGKTKKDAALVQQFVSFADNEFAPIAAAWLYPIMGYYPVNEAATAKAKVDFHRCFGALNQHLTTKTFLVGERITLADIVLTCSVLNFYTMVLDPAFVAPYKNVTRWFMTCINQPNFKAVVGTVELCQKMGVASPDSAVKLATAAPVSKDMSNAKDAIADKSSTKAVKAPKVKAAKVEKVEEKEDLEAIAAAENAKPKEKNPLDLLPKSSLVLDEWKRFYSNNETRPTALDWFWKNFDPTGYAIYRVEYKYNSELTQIFMSSNLVGGFYQRLDCARKYAFGSMLVLGEDKKNEIYGYFVIRGLAIPSEFTETVDFESYKFTKVDIKDAKVRADVDAVFAWDDKVNGKVCADGKVFNPKYGYNLQLTRSRQYLLQNLENSYLEYSQDLSDKFKTNLDDLRCLLSFYKPPSTTSLAKLQEGSVNINDLILRVTTEGKSVALRLSKEMALDELQCFEMYWNYQRSREKLMLSSDTLRSEEDLYVNVRNFYCQERIASIDLIAALLRAREDPSHVYYETAKILSDYIVLSKIGDTDFKGFVLANFLRTFQIIVQGDEMTKSFLTTQNLLEEQSYLELLVIMYYSYYPTPYQSLEVIKSLLFIDFGYSRANDNSDGNANIVVQSICGLCCVLFIEMLNLELLLERLHDRNSSVNTLFDTPEELLGLHDLIWDKFGNSKIENTSAGVIAISWSSFLQLLMIFLSVNCPENYKNFQKQITQTHSDSKSTQKLFQYGYLDAKALDYLIKILAVDGPFQNRNYTLVCKCIVKGCLNVLLVTQNVSSLPDRSKLVQCFANIFHESKPLCAYFWRRDCLVDDLRSLLDATQRAFPIFFEDFISLALSLVADEESADHIFRYLTSLPSYSDFAREQDYQQSFEQVEGTNIWHWKGKYLLTDAQHLNVEPPLQTVAYEIGKDLLLVKFEYSGWHLLLSFLDSYINYSTPANDNANHLFGSNISTLLILRLINSIVLYSDSNTRGQFLDHLGSIGANLSHFGGSPPEALIGIVGEIMNRSCSSVLNIDIISSCLDIYRNLIHYYPGIVWSRLRVQKLLPELTRSNSSSGYILHSVIPSECANGEYSVTISFLQFVRELVFECQSMTNLSTTKVEGCVDIEWIKYEILHASITLITKGIYPAFSSWRYNRIYEKHQIGTLILVIFNSVVGDTTWFFKSQINQGTVKKVEFIQSFLIAELIDRPPTNRSLPLLDIVSIGNLAPLQYHLVGSRKEAEMIEKSIIQALKLLRQLLVIIYNRAGPISPLERYILDRTIENGVSKKELIQIIASYIDYQNSQELTILATEILSLLCLIGNRENSSAISFVGYFGADAFTIVSKVVYLVDNSAHQSSCHALVQMAVLNFVCVVITNQPGLAAMLLNGYESQAKIAIFDQNKDTIALSETSILHPIIEHILDWKRNKIEKPMVLASSIKILEGLWTNVNDHYVNISKLREKKELWVALTDLILDQGSDNDCAIRTYFAISQAYTLNVLTKESYIICKVDLIISDSTAKLILKTLKAALFSATPFGQELFEHDPQLTSTLLQYCNEVYPPINMNNFRKNFWSKIFGSQRQFGLDFVYQRNLIEAKLNIENNEHMFEFAEKLLMQVSLVNINWSISDAQFFKAASFEYAIKTITLKNTSAIFFKNESVSEIEIGKLIKVIINNLKRSLYTSSLHNGYKAILSSSLLSLVSLWASKLTMSRESYQKFVDLLADLYSCYCLNIYPLGPAGYFSNCEFHGHVTSSILVALCAASRISLNLSRAESLLGSILSIICNGIYFVLSDCNSKHHNLESLLQTLFELTRVESGLSVSNWLPIVEKYKVVGLLLSTLTVWKPSLSDQIQSDIPVQILHLLISFSSHPRFTASALSEGIISGLCNNYFSSTLIQTRVPSNPDISSSLVHEVWCLMLSIMINLTEDVRLEHSYLESHIGFIRIHQEQIAFALDRNNDRILTLSKVNEIEKISGLLYRLIVKVDESGVIENKHCSLSTIFMNGDILVRLSYTLDIFVNLFKNVNEFKFRALSKSKFNESTSFDECQALYKHLYAKMLGTNMNIVGILQICTHSCDKYGQSSHLGQGITEALVPASACLGDSGISFGTMFDLIRCLMQSLKELCTQDVTKEPGLTAHKLLIRNIELSLNHTCTKMTRHDCEQESDSIIEARNEFLEILSDLKELYNRADKTWDINIVSDAKNFISCIESLIEFKVVR